MPARPDPARRLRGRFLLTAAVSALTLVGLSACGSDGSGSTSTATPSAAATSASATASGSASGSSSSAVQGAAAAAVLKATRAFLGTLSDDQKTTVQAERSQANLSQWSNLPDQLFKRAGLRMDVLNDAQQAGVLAVLKAGLSQTGYDQVVQITTADGVLAAAGGANLDFGADHYWIRILGTPSPTDKWTLQYGGHHLAVNMTVAGSDITLAPTLWGAQPASYEEASKAYEPLSGETKKAFAMVDSLDKTQLDEAVLDEQIKEIVLGAGQDGKTLAQEGVKASSFTAVQKTMLTDLTDEWLTTLDAENAAAKIAKAKAEIDQTTFAWYGSTEIGNPIYYRVQSPTFVIEFAHQQGQGANAGGVTHIHAIYREVGNDYGAELGS